MREDQVRSGSNRGRRRQTERLGPLEAALAGFADGVVVVDAQGHCVFMNEAGRRVAGREPGPDVPVDQQTADLRLCHQDGRPVPPPETPLARALQGESVADFLTVVGRPDGTE